MKDVLATDLSNYQAIAMSIINGYIPEMYAVGHNYGTFLVEKQSMIDTSYTLYSRESVERLIWEQPGRFYKEFRLLNVTQWEKKGEYKAWDQRRISNQITHGILQGEDIRQVAKRLRNVTGMDARAAMRNARTALTGAQNAGRIDAYERAREMGIPVQKEWLATMDGHTRDSHIDMDGEYVPVDSVFSNGLQYPGEAGGPPAEVYNCRCTLIPRVGDIDRSKENDLRWRRDESLGDMTYQEWKNTHAGRDKVFTTEVPSFQKAVGQATTVDQINDLMNSQGWFATGSTVDLTGCDVESAKSIASSYEQVFDKFPRLKGKFNAPDAHPIGMGSNTYAWCYTRYGGKVQVNPGDGFFGNWANVVKNYESDVLSGWHPFGTTAESIVTHEIGHAIDGLLAREGILGGMTKNYEFRYASSSMKTTIMNRAYKVDSSIRNTPSSISQNVSMYATENNKEWFAECFAEYMTSADPRIVARLFGEELEKLIGRLTS